MGTKVEGNEPGGVATPAPGIGEAGINSVPSDDGSTGDGGTAAAAGQSGGPADYKERIFTDGEFAFQQVTQHQSDKDKAIAELDKIPSQFRQWAETGNADLAIETVQKYLNLSNDPEMGKLIRRYEETGRIDGVEDYIDDTNDDPMNELRAEIQNLKSQLQQTSTQSQFVAVKGKLDNAFAEAFNGIPFTPEEKQRAEQAANTQIERWSSDAQGVEALKQLNAESARSLILQNFSNDELREIYRRDASLQSEQRSNYATDGAGGSTGPSREVPKIDSDGKTIAEIAREAMRQGARMNGLDLNRA